MNRKIPRTAIAILCFALTACHPSKREKTTSETSQNNSTPKGLVEQVLTQEQQQALTPSAVIQTLKAGNIRFTNNDLTARDHSKQVRNSTLSQYPKAIVLSCVDSRIPVEDVFDRGIGDLFVARVAGNFVNEDILGSMEFACKVSGAKLILVMGHEHCGAVKAAVDDVTLGNITSMLQKIKPAIAHVVYEGERSTKNQEFVHKVSESNVKNTLNQIRSKSPILKEMEDGKAIKIVGAIYNMDNGRVDWL